MIDQKKAIAFLGLSPKEKLILGALEEKESYLTSDLARKTKIARTTVHFLLKKLLRRGLVSRVKAANHKEWQLAEREQILGNIKSLFIGLEQSSEALGRIETTALGVEVLRGKNKIKECYRRIFEAGKINRIYFIQGNKSAEVALKKIEKEYFFDFHKELKKRGIIMEGVVGECVLKLFKTLSLWELKSHLGRMIVGHIVPDVYADFSVDILMFKNTVLIVNIDEENIIILRNDSICKIFKNFFELILEKSKKIDLNSYIKTLIEEKQKK